MNETNDEINEEFDDIIEAWEPPTDSSFLYPRAGASDTFIQQVANYISTLGATISLHSADPGQNAGSAQATELSGAGYARRTVAWGRAVVDNTPGSPDFGKAVVTATAAVDFQVPAGATLAFYGVWNGATFLYSKPIDPPVPFPGNGIATMTPKHVFGQV